MMKKMWELHPEIWKTEPKFWAYIRGGLRRGLWEKHPIKLEYIRQNRVKAPLGKKKKNNPDGMVWCCRCEECGKVKRQPEIQVDHLAGNMSLKGIKDLVDFVVGLCFITFSDLQLICKPCHKAKTHSERYGMTMEEAILDKRVIAFIKDSGNKLKHILCDEFNYTLEQVSNPEKRRGAVKELMEANLIK